MKKKLLTLLVLCLAAALLLVTGAAADDTGSLGDGVSWYYYSNSNRLTISAEDPNEAISITKPASWGSVTVSEVREVVINYGITDIGPDFFEGFTSLESIQIPGNLLTVGSRAFSDCTNLKYVNHYSSFEINWLEIGSDNGPFENCLKITGGLCGDDAYWEPSYGGSSYNYITIRLRPGKTSGAMGTPDWTNLTVRADKNTPTNITISDGITSIPADAFNGFTGLVSVDLPVTLESIGANAFRDTNLYAADYGVDYDGTQAQWDSITIAEGNDKVLAARPQHKGACGTDATWSFDPDTGTLSITGSGDITSAPWLGLSSSIYTVVIGEDITGICDAAFQGFRNLTSVSLPSSLKSIGKYAFQGCYNLQSIALPAGLTSIGEYAFANCSDLSGTVTIPEGVTRLEKCAFSQTDIASVKLPSTLTYIGDMAFYYCYSLTSVDIPDSVTEIGERAFAFCWALKTIDLPNELETLGNAAFAGCRSLVSLDIPAIETVNMVSYIPTSATNTDLGVFEVVINEGTQTIGENAFFGCVKLETVTIPKSVTTIGAGAFADCTMLERVNYAGTNQEWDLINVGENNDPLINALNFGTVPGTNLSWNLDRSTGALTVTGSGELETAPWAAYRDLIKSVSLPNGLLNIPDSAFEGSQITSITIPATVETIGARAFAGTDIAAISLPNSVEVIGESCFEGCDNLRSASLSNKLLEIPDNAFKGCSSLTGITLHELIMSVGDGAFSGCTSLSNVTCGEYLSKVYNTTFKDCSNLTLRVYAGSYMEAFARLYGIKYETVEGGGTAGGEGGAGAPGVGIDSITSDRGTDENGKPCTVVTVTLTDGTTEKFYIYDGNGGVTAPAFIDVPASAYYSDAVAWAVANGVTSGTSENTFSPNAACTRAQVVTFLWRAMGSPEPEGSGDFSDVPAGSYYAKAAQWALENGITTGVGGSSFGSNSTVTRAQVVTFLWRAAGSPAVSGGSFADVDSGAYYADAVAWAVRNGITTGTSATAFSPDAGCTRAQIVTFLYRYFT